MSSPAQQTPPSNPQIQIPTWERSTKVQGLCIWQSASEVTSPAQQTPPPNPQIQIPIWESSTEVQRLCIWQSTSEGTPPQIPKSRYLFEKAPQKCRDCVFDNLPVKWLIQPSKPPHPKIHKPRCLFVWAPQKYWDCVFDNLQSSLFFQYDCNLYFYYHCKITCNLKFIYQVRKGWQKLIKNVFKLKKEGGPFRGPPSFFNLP